MTKINNVRKPTFFLISTNYNKNYKFCPRCIRSPTKADAASNNAKERSDDQRTDSSIRRPILKALHTKRHAYHAKLCKRSCQKQIYQIDFFP